MKARSAGTAVAAAQPCTTCSLRLRLAGAAAWLVLGAVALSLAGGYLK